MHPQGIYDEYCLLIYFIWLPLGDNAIQFLSEKKVKFFIIMKSLDPEILFDQKQWKPTL